MSRALRHYYKLNIIQKERGQKLLFRSLLLFLCHPPVFFPRAAHAFIITASFVRLLRFLKLPHDIRKPPADRPEHTPPQGGDFLDASPAHKFSEDHFEVSPDRASPQPPP